MTVATTAIKRRLPAEIRRDRVLEAARRVFLSSGYVGARMHAIATEADVDKRMLYRFWDSKEALFEEAIATPLEQAVERAVNLSMVPPADEEEGSGVRRRSIEFIRDLLSAMREVAPLLGVVLATDALTGERFYRERFEPRLAQIRDVMVANTNQVHARPYNPDVGVRLVYGMCYFFALDHRFGSGTGLSDDDLAAELLSILFDGLVARDSPAEQPPG